MRIREKICNFASPMAIILTILLNAYYFVSFTDKVGSTHYALSEAAIERRARYGIALDDLDKAVSEVYVDSIRRGGGKVVHCSRWMNGVTVLMSDSLAGKMAEWNFIAEVSLTHNLSTKNQRTAEFRSNIAQRLESRNSERQNLLHLAGYKGQGIIISVIDVGFPAVDTAVCYDSLRQEGRLIGKYDLASSAISIDSMLVNHGTNCLSALAAQQPDYTGAAPQAKYLLIRSEEYEHECPKEGDNWIAAVELSDSLGADIISTSLGYYIFDDSLFNYEYRYLDGKTYRPSQAATIAARKGMLVCIAAGNSGTNKDWPWIGVPGDADSILTVGAVQADSLRASFSSYGPTADGRTKPDVMALGAPACLVDPATGSIRYANGTSFACPQIAGLAACLWSAFPQATAMEIRERILRSADRYHIPDYFYGYGIPDGWRAYELELPTGVERVMINEQTRKFMLNGSVYVERNGSIYTLLGEQVR